MAHNPRSVPFAISRRNRKVNRLPGRRKHLARPWLVEQRRDFTPIRFCGQRNASRARLRAKPAAHGPPVLERAHMCKANSHTEDSNAKTLPNSCLKAARFVPESRGIHTRKPRFSYLKATFFMPECCRIHAEAQTRALSIPPQNHAQMPPRSRESAARQHRTTSHHRRTPGSGAMVPGNNPTSLSGTVGQWIALPAIGRRHCDSASRSFLCARALPQRSRLLFRAASESS